MMSPSRDNPGRAHRSIQECVEVLVNERWAENTFRMRLRCRELATQIRPGQFFMVKLPGGSDPLLARPFALYDIWRDGAGAVGGVEFGYVVVGKVTRLLAAMNAGDYVEIWGPLGNGFPCWSEPQIVYVAGGIGQTPFMAAAREQLGREQYGADSANVASPISSSVKPVLLYGVRSARYLAGVEAFQSVGLDVRIATDDGTAGHYGYVTDLLKLFLKTSQYPATQIAVVTCGPEPMMHRVAHIAEQHGSQCWLSLESPMACGFGACFSCVTSIRESNGTIDYARVCIDGPVFNSRQLVYPKS